MQIRSTNAHTHKYTNSPECLLCTCMAASVCLPVITHALPTPPFSACAMTVHLGGMVCHFLSSVHRTSVITEARPRLFYRTSYEGRSDDCTLLTFAFSLLVPFSLFSTLFPPPLLQFFSRSDWHTHTFFVSYLVPMRTVLTSNRGCGGGGSGTKEVIVEEDSWDYNRFSF